jgi:hypothetical protein
LAQDTEQWRALVNVFGFHKEAVYVLTSWERFNFSGTPMLGVR